MAYSILLVAPERTVSSLITIYTLFSRCRKNMRLMPVLNPESRQDCSSRLSVFLLSRLLPLCPGIEANRGLEH
jgi:hypothetical protein